MNWAEILEEKNKRIEELEAQLEERPGESDKTEAVQTLDKALGEEEKAGDQLLVDLEKAEKLIQWIYETLKPPIELTADNKLPAVRAVRERLGKYLEKK